jgi:hypothetical protein
LSKFRLISLSSSKIGRTSCAKTFRSKIIQMAGLENTSVVPRVATFSIGSSSTLKKTRKKEV